MTGPNQPNPDDQPALEPFGPLTAAAVQMHELFRAYVDAGFTEDQAMTMLCAFLTRRPQQ